MSKRADKYNSEILSDLFAEVTPKEQKRTDIRMLLAAKIKDGMNAKGWRNRQLAEALNKKDSVISKWLSGTHNFTSDTLSDIGDVLDIKLLDVESKKKSQIVHYHVQLTTMAVNNKQGVCNPVPAVSMFYPFFKGTKQLQC